MADRLDSFPILIMDDDELVREILGLLLVAAGYTYMEAGHGEEAMKVSAVALKSGKPIRGAFFDLTIPGGMGGKEIISKFRLRFPDVPVFASSGFSDDPIMERPTDFGFTDSICKPFNMRELKELLQKYLPLSA